MRDAGAQEPASVEHDLFTPNAGRPTAPAPHRALPPAPTVITLPWTRAPRAARGTCPHPSHDLHHGHETGESRLLAPRSPCPRHLVPRVVTAWVTCHEWPGRVPEGAGDPCCTWGHGGPPLSTVI